MIGAVGLMVAAGPAAAQPIPLGELSSYLNKLKTVQSEFTQINSDGSLSTGVLYLRRPGRARFEYNPPEKSLVMAGGGQVAVFDPKSNTPPQQYPLKRTPLSIILAPQVNLGRSGMVIGHREADGKTVVTAQDPENPQYGNLQLVFTPNPTSLRQWVVTDDSGAKTTVILGDMRTGMSLGSRMFNIPQEITARTR